MKSFYLITLSFLLFSSQLFSQNMCLDFDGTNDYVQISSFTGGPITQGTFAFWIKLDQIPTTNARIFSEAWQDDEIIINSGTGYITTESTFISGDNLISTNPLEVGVWTHVAITADGSGSKLYINGILDDTGGPSAFSIASASIGGKYTALWEVVPGQLDEFQIWSDVRTEAEIKTTMYQELIGNEANLIAYYNFNETSGTSLTDNSINSNTGTLTNMAGTEWITSAAFFGPKNCLDFDGVNNNVWISSFSPILTEGTIEFWMKPNALPNDNARLISKSADYNGGDEIYLISGNGRLATVNFVVGNNLSSTNPITTGVWTHIAITADGTGSKLYINGELDDVGGAADFSYNSFRIGGQYTSAIWETFDGNMDEVRVWSDIRTQAEIFDNMNKTLTGNEFNLAAYYNFDNTTGTVLQDFTPNGNNGSVGGVPNWVSSNAFNTWLNTDETTWNTASNWSNGVPVSTDNVGIYSYSGSDLNISGTPSVNNLVIGSSTTLTVSSDATVNGNLVLLSNLILNGNIITIANTGMLVENGGILSGTSGYATYTKSVSNPSSENIGGLGIEITSAANLGSTVIERYHSIVTGPTSDEGINRFYKITPTTNTGLNATMVFHYDDSELNGLTESNIKLFKTTDNGVTWTEEGGILDAINNTITLSGIDGFSWWTIAESGATLPIELISFSAQCTIDNSIELNWTTASETNNSHFEIQRSDDAENFYTVGQIDGAGYSNNILNYSLIIENSEDFESYYRLKQIDFDGKYSISKIIVVDCNENRSTDFLVYPNPFTDQISIEFANMPQATYNLVIKNSIGVVILENRIEENALNHTFQLDNVPAGVYYVVVSNEDETVMRKLLKF